MKQALKRIPLLGGLARRLYRLVCPQPEFEGSEQYWKERYAAGGNSGSGSYEALATFKAEVINTFVEERQVRELIEFGSGDGNQLTLAKYPAYIGFDISPEAIQRCRERFAEDSSKRFCLMADYAGEVADLTLSLDVLYHLTEDSVYEAYMERLFEASRRYVIIYSSDFEAPQERHVRRRKFTDWIAARRPDARLLEQITNPYPYDPKREEGSLSDFYLYELG